MPFSVYLRKIMKRVLILLIAVIMLLSLFSCEVDDDDNVDIADHPEVEATYLSDAVRLPEYKGLTIAQKSGESRGDAVWRVVLEGSEVVEFPPSFLSYYDSQTVTKYKIIASDANMSYAELLEALGLTEEDVKNEAKSLATSELVTMAVIEKEALSLTDEEIERLFDKYAEKIASEIGKDVSHVKESLVDEVYDTMLRDKMIEFLITQNTFITEN